MPTLGVLTFGLLNLTGVDLRDVDLKGPWLG